MAHEGRDIGALLCCLDGFGYAAAGGKLALVLVWQCVCYTFVQLLGKSVVCFASAVCELNDLPPPLMLIL